MKARPPSDIIRKTSLIKHCSSQFDYGLGSFNLINVEKKGNLC